MNAMTMTSPMPQMGIRDRIVSYIRVAPDRETKSLLQDILTYLDKPYDLDWLRDEYKLSPAEYRALVLLVDGKTSEAIAEELGTARSTVRAQIHNVYRKTRVCNMPELIALLLQRARNT
jgi:DNA-binding CsgD family transcriptional regulator